MSSIVVILLLAAGFATGYGLRAHISHRRRTRRVILPPAVHFRTGETPAKTRSDSGVCACQYEVTMKIALLLTMFALTPAAEAPPAAEPAPNGDTSIHEQIKADRARAKADEEND